MLNDFPRLLCLLRKEKKISQRKAADGLGVSQALLSHYENGVREPGLEFIVRASDFYGVSTDYLLGRTMTRAMNTPEANTLPDMSAEKDNVLRGSAFAMLQKKLIVNSIVVLMDILGKIGDKTLISSASAYISSAIYRIYRIIYAGNSDNNDAFFSLRSNFVVEACDIDMKQSEVKMKSVSCGNGPCTDIDNAVEMPVLSHEILTQQYPQLAQSLFTLLHSVADRIEKRDKADT